MNHDPCQRLRQVGVLILGTSPSVTLLIVCSSKPLSFADEQTVRVAKSLVINSWKGETSKTSQSIQSRRTVTSAGKLRYLPFLLIAQHVFPASIFTDDLCR